MLTTHRSAINTRDIQRKVLMPVYKLHRGKHSYARPRGYTEVGILMPTRKVTQRHVILCPLTRCKGEMPTCTLTQGQLPTHKNTRARCPLTQAHRAGCPLTKRYKGKMPAHTSLSFLMPGFIYSTHRGF